MKKRIMLAFMACALCTTATEAQTHPQLLPNEQNTIQIFERLSPLVVNVHRLRTVVTRGYQQHDIQSGMGSGFVWNKNGYIVTNYHVIRKANKIAVTLQKGRTVRAKIVGALPRKDIAVLKIDDPNALKEIDINGFFHFPIANSAKLKVGQKALAIGNPFGLDRTLTQGIISAVGREIPGIAGKINNMIQTDASVNPGNSGGPLLDSQGNLIGMNTVIFSTSGTSAGIGFAVPANDIKRTVEQIIQYGHVKQAGIGVQIFSDQITHSIGIKGVLINKVVSQSPADKAGFQGTYRDEFGRIHLGDIITAINGKAISSYDDLNDVLDKVNIGDAISIQYLRGKKPNKVTLRTAEIQ